MEIVVSTVVKMFRLGYFTKQNNIYCNSRKAFDAIESSKLTITAIKYQWECSVDITEIILLISLFSLFSRN